MIGERLAEIRKDHNDTQEHLASKLHISVSTVRSWEREKSAPCNEMLVNIFRLYHITSDYLLGLANKETSLKKTHVAWVLFREVLSSKKSQHDKFVILKRVCLSNTFKMTIYRSPMKPARRFPYILLKIFLNTLDHWIKIKFIFF